MVAEQRTWCGERRERDAGSEVLVEGWVNRKRDMGGLIFIDLRDRSGIVQVVVDQSRDLHLTAVAESLRNEPGQMSSGQQRIPGTTFTGMTRGQRAMKPAGAWTPDQVVDMLIAGMNQGDFYILCPDNEVTREIDNRRIGTGTPGPITQALQKTFFSIVRGEDPSHEAWLTRV